MVAFSLWNVNLLLQNITSPLQTYSATAERQASTTEPINAEKKLFTENKAFHSGLRTFLPHITEPFLRRKIMNVWTHVHIKVTLSKKKSKTFSFTFRIKRGFIPPYTHAHTHTNPPPPTQHVSLPRTGAHSFHERTEKFPLSNFASREQDPLRFEQEVFLHKT